MEDVFSNLLATYGPFTVFLLLVATGFGIPLGEDFIIIPAGILIGHGSLDPVPTAIFAYVGCIVSDCMWFVLCWKYGTPLLHKRWVKRFVHPRRLLEIKHRIERRGAWVIVMSRFIPGSRTPATTAAGILHFPFWKFLVATAVPCVVTVPLQLLLGVAVARGFGTMDTVDVIHRMIAVVVLMIAFLAALAWWRNRRAHRVRRPRAKATWLRRFRSRKVRPAEQPVRTADPTTHTPSGSPGTRAGAPARRASGRSPDPA